MQEIIDAITELDRQRIEARTLLKAACRDLYSLQLLAVNATTMGLAESDRIKRFEALTRAVLRVQPPLPEAQV